jgi:hypothetical protein
MTTGWQACTAVLVQASDKSKNEPLDCVHTIESTAMQTLAKRERFMTRARVRRSAGGRPSMMA